MTPTMNMPVLHLKQTGFRMNMVTGTLSILYFTTSNGSPCVICEHLVNF